MRTHSCYAGNNRGRGNWMLCVECDGRIHDVDCTSKPNPTKDCCPARHRKMGKPGNSAQIRVRPNTPHQAA